MAGRGPLPPSRSLPVERTAAVAVAEDVAADGKAAASSHSINQTGDSDR